MDEFLAILRRSLDERTFLAMTLSRPADKLHAQRVTVRPVTIRGEQRWQWTRHIERQQLHENLDDRSLLERAADLIGPNFRHAHLFTTEADVAARFDKQGRCRIKTGPPTKSAAAVSPSHDREKSYLIPEGRPCAFLHELGVMTAAGRVHKPRRDKFRQINRFLEYVEDVLPRLPPTGELRVVDFGCGLSYLTFALHHLLTVIHKRDVRILGIDQNPQVIERCNSTSRALGLKGIEFRTQPITAAEWTEKIDLAVALHACDTATDEALAAAVHAQSDVILAAPCCQHELAPQLNSDTLELITRHGILRERLAAMATDALRAALLEQAGYRTRIIEFIDTEHTPKNLLIRAVRRPEGASAPEAAAQIDDLMNLLGIEHHRLIDLQSEGKMMNTDVE